MTRNLLAWAAAALAIMGCATTSPSGPVSSSGPGASPGHITSAAAVAPTRPAGPAIAAVLRRISVTAVGSPDGMAYGAGSLWVGGYNGNAIAQLDPRTGRTIRVIKVASNPLGVAVLDGSVWVASYSAAQVSRIDPGTGKVTATIAVGANPDSFAMIGRDLWAFEQGASAAAVIDPATAKVLRTVRLPVQAGWASSGAGRYWVPDLNGTSNTVIGLDPATGAIRVTVQVGPHPSEVAFGFGAGWVTCQGAIYRFDPATGKVRAVITIPNSGMDGVAVTAGAIWAGDINAGTVDRIDPATNSVTGTLAVGGGPRHIVAIGGTMWVASFDDQALVQLRPAESG